jgi:uncharacterized protein YhaN
LDALIKEHLMGISAVEKKLVETDVPDLIGSIDRVCADAIAKIEAKSKQIVVKISIYVETAMGEFFKDTEAARLKISSIVNEPSDSHDKDVAAGMISEITFLSINRISQRSQDLMGQIRTEAEASIQDLRYKTAEAFKNFRTLATKVAARIKESVTKVVDHYETSRKSHDLCQSREQIKGEIEKAAMDAECAALELTQAKERAIVSINEALDAANQRIEQAFAAAALEIQQAETRAVVLLNETAEVALRRYGKTLAPTS